jgi:excisionase family DNA binding protein
MDPYGINIKTYSTAEVAELVGISWDTIHRWMREKKIKAPPAQSIGRVRVRLWTEADVVMVKKYKAEHYRKKPSRKKAKKYSSGTRRW